MHPYNLAMAVVHLESSNGWGQGETGETQGDFGSLSTLSQISIQYKLKKKKKKDVLTFKHNFSATFPDEITILSTSYTEILALPLPRGGVQIRPRLLQSFHVLL